MTLRKEIEEAMNEANQHTINYILSLIKERLEKNQEIAMHDEWNNIEELIKELE